MRSIRDKNALVTGAAAGIGRAIALRLAREGAHLYLLDVNEPGLAKVVSTAKHAGVNALGRYCDVSQPSNITAGVADALARWDKIDILVNNAGITYYGDTEKMSANDADRLLAINLLAPIQFTRELLPTLLAQPEAHVLNVASFFGLIGTRKLALYTASKFGLVGFSESLRAEYGRRGLGVTSLCPGFVDTELFDTASRGTDRQESKRPPEVDAHHTREDRRPGGEVDLSQPCVGRHAALCAVGLLWQAILSGPIGLGQSSELQAQTEQSCHRQCRRVAPKSGVTRHLPPPRIWYNGPSACPFVPSLQRTSCDVRKTATGYL